MPTFYSLSPLFDGSVTTAKLAANAVTLGKMATGTAGNLITYSAAGAPAAVTTGTAAQVLTSNGAGAAPTFQAAAGGGAMVHKASGTIALQAATTTFGIDYADVSFAAAELAAGDIIQIFVEAYQTTQNVNMRLDFLNTTSNPTSTDTVLASGNADCSVHMTLIQSAENTDKINIVAAFWNGVVLLQENVATGDANVFTTAFTIRINLRNSGASTARTARYKVIYIKSS